MTEFEYLYSLDAISGYHQILMNKADKEKTFFITEDRTYYYKVMPFGLKNTKATYQKLMNKFFKDQIGRNQGVYVDDMIIKSKLFEEHMKDLEEIFSVPDQYQMKFNLIKCAFFIRGAKFLGYMVSAWGIKPNPKEDASHSWYASVDLYQGCPKANMKGDSD